MIIPDLLGDRVSSISLNSAQVQRYARHLIMPEVAMEGQKRLKAARVLCIGTGGLGSPLSLYLAAAGVGTLGLADFDVVDVSNLQRQIIHFTRDVGRSKIESAQEKLEALNPDLHVVRHEQTIDSSNALELLGRLRRHRRRHGQLSDSLPGERRRACCWESRTFMARSSGSTARRRSSSRRTGHAIAVSIPSRRRRTWFRIVRRGACSASCRV